MNTTNQVFSKKSNYLENLPVNDSIKASKHRVVKWNSTVYTPKHIISAIQTYSNLIDKKTDPNWYPYEGEETYNYTDKQILNITDSFKNALSGVIPENGIYKIDKGIVFDDGMVVSSSNFLPYTDLYWFTSVTSSRNIPLATSLQRRQVSNLTIKDGKCLNLLTPWADVNHYHFILDCITKLDIVQNVSPLKLKDFDFILLPECKNKEAKYLISHFNIPTNKILTIPYNQQYQFTDLYSPSQRSISAIVRPNSLNSIINAFKLQNNKPHKKLYISRQGYTRSVANEDQVWCMLKQYGFIKINPAEIDNCSELFNDASVVVGPHGAGLTNIIFCQRDVKVIELIPYFWQYTYYISLAHACNLKYTGIICGDKDSFVVDISDLEYIVKEH